MGWKQRERREERARWMMEQMERKQASRFGVRDEKMI